MLIHIPGKINWKTIRGITQHEFLLFLTDSIFLCDDDPLSNHCDFHELFYKTKSVYSDAAYLPCYRMVIAGPSVQQLRYCKSGATRPSRVTPAGCAAPSMNSAVMEQPVMLGTVAVRALLSKSKNDNNKDHDC